MTQRFEYSKENKVIFSNYLVVIEFNNSGYIMANMECAEEAESLARRIVSHINISLNEDAEFSDAINSCQVIKTYEVKGNATFISNSVWCDMYGMCEVYVVGINKKDGGIKRFVREREYCSEFISLQNHLIRYERVMEKFKRFAFGAN